ncbi:YgfZ/GcvT domain-containing protein [Halomonas halocynthiae]|uniref:CAF17-like 4Fe-4S cluster assembly/insertion protein YgfZ n=1 Tax=Halomonas halocynthiae TaxID=176290 RepID=UPI000410FE10|nr:folate-binding protein YgfZ [Halomonas halocynthiae]
MTDWITRNGGHRHDSRVEFNTPEQAQHAFDTTVITPLVQFGVLDVIGSDAERFLQGQTSTQLSLINGHFAGLTCFCSVKGRVIANAQLLRVEENHYRLLLDQSAVGPLAAHLKKFIPFYKAELTSRDDVAIIGIMGKEAHAIAEVQLDVSTPTVWHQSGDSQRQLLAHPGPCPRLVVCVPTDNADALWQTLITQTSPVNSNIWTLHDIQAGLAWLSNEQSDTYLPQMINWEALGGISFRKGCYTGQEVVARAHFRGQVKKRLMRGQLDCQTLPALGSLITDEAGKRLGDVISAEYDAYQKVEVLAVVTQRDPEPERYIDGHKLQRLNLPYSIERVDPEQLAEDS